MNDSKTYQLSFLDHMSCNTEVNIQVLIPDQVVRLRSRLIGVDPGVTIILELGADEYWHKAKDFMLNGQELIIRIVKSDGADANLLAFKSKIQRIEHNSASWLLIHYPEELQKVALRHQYRIPINIGAEITLADTDNEDDGSEIEAVTGVLRDISIKGGAFVSPWVDTIVSDTDYLLKVVILPDMETIVIPITIRNMVSIKHDENQCQYGFSINSSQEKAEMIVQRLLLCHLLTLE
ncbi:hypothetical protein GCM10007978_34410 [Shewanella hanedai]|uniref:Flagellar brake protein n=1 Tax=Shewanella hanedai TaxID=25 RepID=A0A553JJT9_SHEHA|nr:PilZ domain-containing protein [Shewanella hanedai]TRY12727.1 flagellar brake protein [Shewanella hanedai]GGI93929.1 hypothetical protein GCM10007978_34410 [Shewanella hanedai]